MSVASKVLNAAIDTEIRARVKKLRAKTYSELTALPDTWAEEVSLLGTTVTLTIFCEHYPSRLLVLVRSDRSAVSGLVSMGGTEGFWVEPSGAQIIASDKDVLDFFA